MPGLYIFNGSFLEDNQASIHPDNRGYRYGDGLFETLRVCHGKVPLWDLHMDRLYSGLETLKMPLPKLVTRDSLKAQVEELCSRNRLSHARIRLSVSRGDGGILEAVASQPNICIQSWPLDEALPRFNQNGLRLGVFPDAAKHADFLANLKSSNYLVYVMAALYAREQKWNDAIVLNSQGRIADTTIANICWVRDGEIYTTPASEGPVSGVMLRWLKGRVDIREEALSPEALATASEVFIANAVRGVQWVSHVGDHAFHDFSTAFRIHSDLISPLFS